MARKIIIRLLIIGIFFGLTLSFKASVGVNAQIDPIAVSVDGLMFGMVFPGEALEKEFTVSLVPGGEEVLEYEIVQTPKPGYMDLCPFLRKESLEGEGDVEENASLNAEDDTSDVWKVYLDVPAIRGYVSQDHAFALIDEGGQYGCDIAVDIIKEGEEEEEEEEPEPEPGPRPVILGGSGGGPDTHLIVHREENISQTSADISWTATPAMYCYVVYDTISHPVLGPAPFYGYANMTEETEERVNYYKITLGELEPGVEYFYMVVCSDPGQIRSVEHSFRTLGGMVEGTTTEPLIEVPMVGAGAGAGEQEEEEEGEGKVAGEAIEREEEPAGEMEEEPFKIEIEEVGEPGAGLGGFIGENLCWLLFLWILVLSIVFAASYIRKKEEV